MHKWTLAAGAVLAFIPVAALLIFTLRYAPEIPIWDGWSWVLALRDYNSAWRTLGYVHIEHPYGLPTLLFIATGGPFAYSFKVTAVLSALVLIAVAALLIRCVRESGDRTLAAVLIVIFTALSLRQAENVLAGFQLGFPLTVLFGVASVYLAGRAGSAQSIAIAAVWSVAMILTLLAGGRCSAASVAAFPAVLVAAYGRRFFPLVATTSVPVALWWGWSFIPGLKHVAGHVPDPTVSEMALGFLRLAGSPLVHNHTAASLIGLASVAVFLAFAAVAWKRNDHAKTTLIAIGVLSLSYLSVIALGRGVLGGISPGRYTTFGLPFVAITFVLIVQFVTVQSRQVAAAVMLLIAVVAYGVNARKAVEEGRAARANAFAVIDHIINFQSRGAQELSSVNPGPTEWVRSLIGFLSARQLNVFSGPTPLKYTSKPLDNFRIVGGASWEKIGAEEFRMQGPHHIFVRSQCGTPCVVKLEFQSVTTNEKGNVGFIFYDRSGAELLNLPHSVDYAAQRHVVQTAAGPSGAASVDAYVFAPTGRDGIAFARPVFSLIWR